MDEYPSAERIEKEFESGDSKEEVIAGLSWELAVRQRDHGELQDVGWGDVVESVNERCEENDY